MIEVFPATALEDVELLRPILENTVRDHLTGNIVADEVDEVLGSVSHSNQGELNYYFAAARISGGMAVGMIGLRPPIEVMKPFAITANPIELINAYVLESSRGHGVGRALASHIEAKARHDGHTELILNSGPRYRKTGWPFWIGRYGMPVGMLKDHYGPGASALVWRTKLD